MAYVIVAVFMSTLVNLYLLICVARLQDRVSKLEATRRIPWIGEL